MVIHTKVLHSISWCALGKSAGIGLPPAIIRYVRKYRTLVFSKYSRERSAELPIYQPNLHDGGNLRVLIDCLTELGISKLQQ